MTTKIIFLDFDGVLNHGEWFQYGKQDSHCDEYGAKAIDPACVGLLNVIVDRTDADVVVSSTWRFGGLHHVRAVLYARGFIGHVRDITPLIQNNGDGKVRLVDMTAMPQPEDLHSVVAGRERGHEIQAWIDWQHETTKPDHIVILDDSNDMAHLLPYLVRTSHHDGGLKPEHVALALEMLRRPFPRAI